jgi:hypothetical protein
MARGSQSVADYNWAHKESRKISMEPVEKQYLRAHKKSFLKYLHDIGIDPLRCQKLGHLYDAKVYHSKKDSNIMAIYPHPMSTFIEHFADDTLHLLKGKSATIHISNTRKLAGDPADIKQNPKPRI